MGNLQSCYPGSNSTAPDVQPATLTPSSSGIFGSTTSGKGISEGSSSGYSGYSFGDNPSFGETPPESGEILEKPNLRVFSFAELKSATKNFRPETVLGEGGFGKVYRGWIDDKVVVPSACKSGSKIAVAIKKLNSESVQGFEEWQSEVNFLGRLAHPNLVKLLGYCWEDTELLLVYEYLPKGSLENHLFRRNPSMEPLSWDRRISIALGVARGLAFLHNSDKQVIYRDFKAANILLDAIGFKMLNQITISSSTKSQKQGNYDAKLSDFGLAKLGPAAGKSHVTTRIMGTHGYAAPEYVATGRLYVNSDVYGFGVVLLEMLTGFRALDMNRPKGQQNLVDWTKPFLSNKSKLKSIMDQKMDGQYSLKVAFEVARLVVKCINLDPKARPCMNEVVEVLQKVESMSIKEKPIENRKRNGVISNGNHRQSGSFHRSPYHPRHHGSRMVVNSQ